MKESKFEISKVYIKNIGIKKSGFVTKTQFLWQRLSIEIGINQFL